MRTLFFVILFIAAGARLCSAANLPVANVSPVVSEPPITDDQTVTEQMIITEPPTSLTSGSPAPSAPAAKVYKWVDDNGLTHYGDEPPSKDMAPLSLPDIQILNNDDLGNVTTSAPQQTVSDQTVTSSDDEISISAPKNNESIMQNKDGIVVITLSLHAPLLENQHISLIVDGNETATGNAGTVNLALALGNHSAQASIIDDKQNILASSEEINFIVTANNNYSVHYVDDREHHRPRPTDLLSTAVPTSIPTIPPSPTVKPTQEPKSTRAPKPIPKEFNTTPKPVPYTSG